MGTLQHSGLRLPASGHLPGRLLALDTNDDRLRPFAALNGMPFTEGLRTLMRGLHLEKPEGITLPPITRALYGYFGYGMGELLQQEAGKLPAPKGRRRQSCSAGNRARVRPPVQPAVPDQPRRTQGRERRTDAGMRRGPALHRQKMP